MNKRNRRALFGLLAFVVIPTISCSSNERLISDTGNPPSNENGGYDHVDKEEFMQLTLKDIADKYYKGNLFIGTANHGKLIGELSGNIALKEYDYMTPSNDFKQTYIHPTPDKWKWDLPDTWIRYAQENKIRLRLHSPVSPQCSKWVKEDNRTAAELSQMLTEYMTELCKRYANKTNVVWMDVVNETIAKEDVKDPVFGLQKKGDWFSARQGTDLWENPWTIIGYDENSPIRTPLYIDKAFEISNQYAPGIKQIINQHGNFEPEVWEKMKQLVGYLREKGRRVDGVGWQAHIDTGWEQEVGNLERLDGFITWCHENQLEFHITEMNVWIKDGDAGKEQAQAETYAKVAATLFKHTSTGKTGINFWNVRDEDTANPNWMGCLWRNDGSTRPAYRRIKEELYKYIPDRPQSAKSE